MSGVEVGRWCLLELLGFVFTSAVAKTSHSAISNSSFSKTRIMLWLSFKDFDSCPSIKDKLPLTSPPYLSSFFLPAPCVPSSPRCAETGILTILGVLMILQACIPGSPDYSTNECAIPSSQMGSLPNISLKKGIGWDFAGSPVVKTSPHNAGVADLIPGWGAKISGALGPKIQNIKQEQCSKFKKDLKNDPHYKRNLKRN